MKKDFWKVTADLVCIFIFAIPLWVYNLLNVVPLARFGFFCSDNSIRYPYRNSTVSSGVMVVVTLCIIILTTIVVEVWLYKKHQLKCPDSPFHPVAMEMYRAIGYYLVGACMCQFLTDVAKLTLGRLRPHFYELCQPNINCSTVDPYTYIDNYQCTRTSHPLIPPNKFDAVLRDARKSFPSGHASFSMFLSLYVIIYLEYRMRSQNTRILRHLFQVGVMAYGVWVACTRVFDYKHRLSDVAGGLILGAIVGVFASYLFIRSSQSMIRRSKAKHCQLNQQGLPTLEVYPSNEMQTCNPSNNPNRTTETLPDKSVANDTNYHSV